MIGKTFTFETGVVSHTGYARDHNEDDHHHDQGIGLWVVADGMGGHEGGEFASGAIVDHLQSIGRPTSAPDLQARFVDRLTKANDLIHDRAKTNGVTIGSTVVGLLVFQEHFACMWSGDSRIYLVRDGQLKQMSKDHTEANELLDRKVITEEEAANWPRKNVITRAVGVAEDMRLDQKYGSLQARDTFLLCSDGLTAHVTDTEILDAVSPALTPQRVCDRLLDLVLDRGATDNTTVMVVRVFDQAEITERKDVFALPEEEV